MGELECGDGFEEGEEGTAEGPCLLTGDDCHRLRIGQPGRGVPTRWRRAAALLLRREALRHLGPAAPLSPDPLSGIVPGVGRLGIARVEGSDLAEVECVVAGEGPHPRQAADVHRQASGRRLPSGSS